MEKTTVKARVASERTRVGGVARGRLNLSKQLPGYQLRLVNDVNGRVEELMDRGYEPVSREEATIGANRANIGSPEGTINRVDVGLGVKAVLMKIPQEFYDEDQRDKAGEIDRREEALKNPALEGGYGSVSITR